MLPVSQVPYGADYKTTFYSSKNILKHWVVQYYIRVQVITLPPVSLKPVFWIEWVKKHTPSRQELQLWCTGKMEEQRDHLEQSGSKVGQVSKHQRSYEVWVMRRAGLLWRWRAVLCQWNNTLEHCGVPFSDQNTPAWGSFVLSAKHAIWGKSNCILMASDARACCLFTVSLV